MNSHQLFMVSISPIIVHSLTMVVAHGHSAARAYRGPVYQLGLSVNQLITLRHASPKALFTGRSPTVLAPSEILGLCDTKLGSG